MKIIIIGAGQVGSDLAENLIREENDITLVDIKSDLLHEIQNRLDLRTVIGNGASPEVIRLAGANDADMLIAVTNRDEVNMIACQIAYSLFKVPKKIARIRDHTLLSYPQLFKDEAIPIDVSISPELIITHLIKPLLEHPGALQVLDFADGKVQLVSVKPFRNGPMVGKSIAELHAYVPSVNIRVVAIYRHNTSLPSHKNTIIEVGDEVFFIATPNHIKETLFALGRLENPYQRIIIAGGGRIGSQLAKQLEQDYQIKVIDHNPKNTQELAEQLNHATVLLGRASDKNLLIDENIEHTDVFIAVTNDDEANIMSSLQAKRLGAKHVMALINQPNYIELIESSAIDIAISPQLATTNSILRHIRIGDVKNVYSLRRGAAEAIEIIANGDEHSSKVINKKISEIRLPPGTQVGAIVRGDEVLITNEDIPIQSGDHIILFVVEKKYIHDVEKLFQVKLGYF